MATSCTYVLRDKQFLSKESLVSYLMNNPKELDNSVNDYGLFDNDTIDFVEKIDSTEILNYIQQFLPTITMDQIRTLTTLEQFVQETGVAALGNFTGMIHKVGSSNNPTGMFRFFKDKYGQVSVKLIRHEVVHAALNLFMHPQEKLALINAYRIQYPTETEGLTDLLVEEAIADRFANQKDITKVSGIIRTLFDKILEALGFINSNKNLIEEFYNKLGAGKITQMSPDINPSTNFIKLFGNAVTTKEGAVTTEGNRMVDMASKITKEFLKEFMQIGSTKTPELVTDEEGNTLLSNYPYTLSEASEKFIRYLIKRTLDNDKKIKQLDLSGVASDSPLRNTLTIENRVIDLIIKPHSEDMYEVTPNVINVKSLNEKQLDDLELWNALVSAGIYNETYSKKKVSEDGKTVISDIKLGVKRFRNLDDLLIEYFPDASLSDLSTSMYFGDTVDTYEAEEKVIDNPEYGDAKTKTAKQTISNKITKYLMFIDNGKGGFVSYEEVRNILMENVKRLGNIKDFSKVNNALNVVKGNQILEFINNVEDLAISEFYTINSQIRNFNKNWYFKDENTFIFNNKVIKKGKLSTEQFFNVIKNQINASNKTSLIQKNNGEQSEFTFGLQDVHWYYQKMEAIDISNVFNIINQTNDENFFNIELKDTWDGGATRTMVSARGDQKKVDRKIYILSAFQSSINEFIEKNKLTKSEYKEATELFKYYKDLYKTKMLSGRAFTNDTLDKILAFVKDPSKILTYEEMDAIVKTNRLDISKEDLEAAKKIDVLNMLVNADIISPVEGEDVLELQNQNLLSGDDAEIFIDIFSDIGKALDAYKTEVFNTPDLLVSNYLNEVLEDVLFKKNSNNSKELQLLATKMNSYLGNNYENGDTSVTDSKGNTKSKYTFESSGTRILGKAADNKQAETAASKKEDRTLENEQQKMLGFVSSTESTIFKATQRTLSNVQKVITYNMTSNFSGYNLDYKGETDEDTINRKFFSGFITATDSRRNDKAHHYIHWLINPSEKGFVKGADIPVNNSTRLIKQLQDYLIYEATKKFIYDDSYYLPHEAKPNSIQDQENFLKASIFNEIKPGLVDLSEIQKFIKPDLTQYNFADRMLLSEEGLKYVEQLSENIFNALLDPSSNVNAFSDFNTLFKPYSVNTEKVDNGVVTPIVRTFINKDVVKKLQFPNSSKLFDRSSGYIPKTTHKEDYRTSSKSKDLIYDIKEGFVEADAIQNAYITYWMNNYINGLELNLALMGDITGYKNAETVIKRASSMWGPRLSPNIPLLQTGQENLAKKHFRVVVGSDTTVLFSTTEAKEMLDLKGAEIYETADPDVKKLYDEEKARLIKEGKAVTATITDGANWIFTRGVRELEKMYPRGSYLGDVIKDLYVGQNQFSQNLIIKNATVHINDELTRLNPALVDFRFIHELYGLREILENSKVNAETLVGLEKELAEFIKSEESNEYTGAKKFISEKKINEFQHRVNVLKSQQYTLEKNTDEEIGQIINKAKDIFRRSIIAEQANPVTLEEWEFLQEMYALTEHTYIRAIVKPSAFKAMKMKDETNYLDFSNAEFKINPKSVLVLNNRDWGVQLKAAQEVAKGVNIFTQLLNHIGYTKNVASNIPIIKEVYEALAQTFQKNADELLEQFKVTEQLDGSRYDKFMARLRDYIISKLEKNTQDSGERMEELMRLGTSLNLPSVVNEVITQLFSTFNNKITSVKFTGGKLVIASEATLQYDLNELKAQLNVKDSTIENKKYKPEYDFKTNTASIVVSEAFIRQFPAFKNMTVAQINKELESKDYFMLGVRIPSTGYNSGAHLKIKQVFEGNRFSNTVYLPGVLVAISGADYDVDSLFIVSGDYHSGNDTKIKIKFDGETLVFDEKDTRKFVGFKSIVEENPDDPGNKRVVHIPEENYKKLEKIIRVLDGGLKEKTQKELIELYKLMFSKIRTDFAKDLLDLTDFELLNQIKNKIAELKKEYKVTGASNLETLKNIDTAIKELGATDIVQKENLENLKAYVKIYYNLTDKFSEELLTLQNKQKELRRLYDSYLKNKVVLNFMNLMTDPKNREDSQLVTDLTFITDTKDVKSLYSKIINKFKGLNPDSKDVSEDEILGTIKGLGSLFADVSQIKLEVQTKDSAALIGITSAYTRGSSNLIYIYHVENPNDTYNENGDVLGPKHKFKIKFNEKLYDRFMLTEKVKETYVLINRLINVSIDDPKEKILGILNLNKSNSNAYLSLAQLGFDIEELTLIFRQPVVLDMGRDSFDKAVDEKTDQLKKMLSKKAFTEYNALVKQQDFGDLFSQKKLDKYYIKYSSIEKFMSENPDQASIDEFAMVQLTVLKNLSMANKLGKGVMDMANVVKIYQDVTVKSSEIPDLMETLYSVLDLGQQSVTIPELNVTVTTPLRDLHKQKSLTINKDFPFEIKSLDAVPHIAQGIKDYTRFTSAISKAVFKLNPHFDLLALAITKHIGIKYKSETTVREEIKDALINYLLIHSKITLPVKDENGDKANKTLDFSFSDIPVRIDKTTGLEYSGAAEFKRLFEIDIETMRQKEPNNLFAKNLHVSIDKKAATLVNMHGSDFVKIKRLDWAFAALGDVENGFSQYQVDLLKYLLLTNQFKFSAKNPTRVMSVLYQTLGAALDNSLNKINSTDTFEGFINAIVKNPKNPHFLSGFISGVLPMLIENIRSAKDTKELVQKRASENIKENSTDVDVSSQTSVDAAFNEENDTIEEATEETLTKEKLKDLESDSKNEDTFEEVSNSESYEDAEKNEIVMNEYNHITGTFAPAFEDRMIVIDSKTEEPSTLRTSYHATIISSKKNFTLIDFYNADTYKQLTVGKNTGIFKKHAIFKKVGYTTKTVMIKNKPTTIGYVYYQIDRYTTKRNVLFYLPQKGDSRNNIPTTHSVKGTQVFIDKETGITKVKFFSTKIFKNETIRITTNNSNYSKYAKISKVIPLTPVLWKELKEIDAKLDAKKIQLKIKKGADKKAIETDIAVLNKRKFEITTTAEVEFYTPKVLETPVEYVGNLKHVSTFLQEFYEYLNDKGKPGFIGQFTALTDILTTLSNKKTFEIKELNTTFNYKNISNLNNLINFVSRISTNTKEIITNEDANTYLKAFIETKKSPRKRAKFDFSADEVKEGEEQEKQC